MEVSHEPWNKSSAQGQKAPLTPEQVGAVKLILANKGRLRDSALFSIALDTCSAPLTFCPFVSQTSALVRHPSNLAAG